MVTYSIKAGTTDVSVVIRIIDSTDGTPETGVVFNTSGIDLEYRREGAVSTDITEATLSALSDAHADGGFLHIGNGYYRLDLPDAAVAAGSVGVLVHGIVTGMVVIGCYVQLVAYNPFDTIRLGLTALPNAAADAAGGLPISDAGGLDLDDLKADINTIDDFLDTEVAAILADTNELQTDLADGGRLDLLIDAILLDTGTTLDDLIDTEIASIITTLGTPAGASISADIAAIEAQTDDIGAAGAGLTAVPWNAAWDAEVQSEVADALAVYDPPTNAELVSEIDAVQTDIAALPTAAENADAIWDEDATGHQTQGSFGQAIGDPGADADTIWALANTNLNATVSSRASQTSLDTVDDFLDTEIAAILEDTGTTLDDLIDTEIAAIKAKTDNLPADPADASDIASSFTTLSAKVDTIDDFLDTEITAIKTVTDLLNAAQAEPTGAPDANETPLEKLGYIFMALRNKLTVTSSAKSFYDDGGNVEWSKSLSDDSTTYTENEGA